MNTRTGKIARLPRAIREQLNHRLDNGHDGPSLLRWLNRQPEVRQILHEKFAGKPISPQNLSEWKAGGFQDWRARQDYLEEALDLTDDAAELAARRAELEAHGNLSDQLAAVLTTRYAALISSLNGQVTKDLTRQIRVLHQLSQDVAALRRADHRLVRLQFQSTQQESELVALFKHWCGLSKVRKWLDQEAPHSAERDARLRYILGIPEPEPEVVAQASRLSGSNPARNPRKKSKSKKVPMAATRPTRSSFQFTNPLVTVRNKKQKRHWLNNPTDSPMPAHQREMTPEDYQEQIDRLWGGKRRRLALQDQAPPAPNANAAVISLSSPKRGVIPSRGSTRGEEAFTSSASSPQVDNQGKSNQIKPKNMGEPQATSTIAPMLPITPTLTPEQLKTEEANRLWRIAHHFE